MNEEFIRKTYSPTFNPWFSTEIIYEGWGVASFERPIGTVEGMTKIVVNNIGKLDVIMEYEKLNTVVKVSGTGYFQIEKFLNGNLGDEHTIYYGTGHENVCTSLVVTTEDGIFSSEGSIYYDTLFGSDNKVNYSLQGGTFKVQEADVAEYWVVPLTNFVSHFPVNNHPLLLQHPLRLFKTPTIPGITDEKLRWFAHWTATQKNRLIGFEFGEKYGFIERLPDYSEREKRLKSGDERQCITALMIAGIIQTVDSMWFPHDYANLISIASGTIVNAAWMECRVANGKLTSRTHFHIREVPYEKGHATIDEVVHKGGLGEIITVSSQSSQFTKTYCRVLINQLTQLISNSRQSETHTTILSRAIEGLCEAHGLAKQNLAADLPANYGEKIDEILYRARSDIQKLSQKAKKENLLSARDVLKRMESRILDVKNKDGDFGRKVICLLDHYGLSDASAMEQYYSGQDRPTWAQVLSQFRNAPIHHGYFEFQNGTFELSEISAIQDHLFDILVRIVLKVIDYRGEYQPRVIDHTTDRKTVDWVTKSISSKELGYGG